MLHYVVCRECPTYMPDAADPGTGLCSAHQRADALEAENAALRSAIEEPVPDLEPGSRDGRDRCCRLCGWDVAPIAPSDHESSCPLAAPPSELGARIVKELAERRRLGDALAEAVNSYMTGVMTTLPMTEAVVAWRALDRRDGEGA